MTKNPKVELKPKFILQFSPCYIGIQQGNPELLRWLDTYVHLGHARRLALGALAEVDRHAAAAELPEHLIASLRGERSCAPALPVLKLEFEITMARTSTARTTIDFDRPGKQIGFVDIPHSPHEDAWGATRIPIAVISNGSGPTVILQAGNHGDEYEGPITLGELMRELDPGAGEGTPDLLARDQHAGRARRPPHLPRRRTQPQPHLPRRRGGHHHAADLGLCQRRHHAAGRRLSGPSFGRFVAQYPAQRDHRAVAPTRSSAGRTSRPCWPSTPRSPSSSTISASRAPRQRPRCAGADHRGNGNGGRRHGVARCPRHLPQRRARRARASRHSRGPGKTAISRERSCVFRAMTAMCLPRPTACSSRCTHLGAMVRAGQAAGRIHKLADPGRAPETVFYAADGMVYGRRQPGRVVVGNCCVTVAAPYEGAIA